MQQLNSTSSWVELSCCAINQALLSSYYVWPHNWFFFCYSLCYNYFCQFQLWQQYSQFLFSFAIFLHLKIHFKSLLPCDVLLANAIYTIYGSSVRFSDIFLHCVETSCFFLGGNIGYLCLAYPTRWFGSPKSKGTFPITLPHSGFCIFAAVCRFTGVVNWLRPLQVIVNTEHLSSFTTAAGRQCHTRRRRLPKFRRVVRPQK